MEICDGAAVREQYAAADKLNLRISIHEKYSTNRQGFAEWLASHYRIEDGMSVLELGCGTGGMWMGKHALIKKCSRVVLSDLSEGMLEQAKRNLRDLSGIEYRTIDIQDIPYEADRFDVVIANMMLYHVPDLPKGLEEVRRVLKENGSFYCATYGEHGMMAYISSLFASYGVSDCTNRAFTLQNGVEKLSPFFSEVARYDYEDSLRITKVEDMVSYIRSTMGMAEWNRIPADTLIAVLKEHMSDGVLVVPKEYGMFVCR